MGFIIRRRKRLTDSAAVSVTPHGASVSKRAGRVSVSSRGRGSVRIARGISFRFKL